MDLNKFLEMGGYLQNKADMFQEKEFGYLKEEHVISIVR